MIYNKITGNKLNLQSFSFHINKLKYNLKLTEILKEKKNKIHTLIYLLLTFFNKN